MNIKKNLIIILIIAVLTVGLFILTGCNESTNNTATNTEAKKAESTSVVGSWKNDEYGSDFIYTFNSDGSGKYDAAGTLMEFTYTIDGSRISIMYTGNTVPFETEFSVSGDILNVKDSMGKDTLYKKVN